MHSREYILVGMYSLEWIPKIEDPNIGLDGSELSLFVLGAWDKSGLGAFLFSEFIHWIHLGFTRWLWKFVHAMVCLWSNYWKPARRLMKMGIKQEKIELDLSTSFKTALCNCNVEKIDFLEWTIEYLFRFPSNLGGWEDKVKHLNPEQDWRVVIDPPCEGPKNATPSSVTVEAINESLKL